MSFNPFYSSSDFGVTTPDSLTLLLDLETSALGPTTPEVASAVCHLCGLLEADDSLKPIPLNDYYPVAKDYYDRFLNDDPSGLKCLTLTSYVSAYFHELRHVHDLISTGYGQNLLFKYLNYYQNVPALVADLTHWQERNPSVDLELPLGPNLFKMKGIADDIRNLVDGYPALNSAIDQLHNPGDGFHGRLTVRHLMECSATNAQIYFVNDVFGEDAYNRLIEFIAEGTETPEYWQINSDMVEAYYAKGFRGRGLGKVISYIAWIALFGGRHHDSADGVPIVVFYEALAEHVLHHIKTVDKTVDFNEVQSLVEDFCSDWGLETPAQRVESVQKNLHKQAAKLEKAWHDQGEASEIGADLVASYKQLVGAFGTVNTLIDQNPELYFGNYGWFVMSGKLPSANVLIKRNGELLHGASVGTKLLPKEEWDHMARMATTLTVLLDGPSPESPFAFLEQDILTDLRNYAPAGVALRI